MKILRAGAAFLILMGTAAPFVAHADIPADSFDECLNWCDENVPGPSAANHICYAQCGREHPQGFAARADLQPFKLD